MTSKITTNARFDGLTNLDIATHYKDKSYYFFKKDFLSALAYWIVSQSPYVVPDISKPLKAFNRYIKDYFSNPQLPEKFTYKELQNIVNINSFIDIPEIYQLGIPKSEQKSDILNSIFKLPKQAFNYMSRYSSNTTPDDDFIDIGALARNAFFTMLRKQITQGLYSD
jgi:hypothetical protein